MGALTRKLRKLLLGQTRVVMISTAALAAALVGVSSLIDEGEIVRLTTLDARGRTYVTQLWIVDLDAGAYLRARSSDAAWLARIRSEPEVTLQRHDVDGQFQALGEGSTSILAAVNLAMGEKYGLADRFWARFSDPTRAVPIRLAPLSASAAATP